MVRRGTATLLCLMLALPAGAESVEMTYTAVMHVREAQSMPVLDDETHRIGIAAFRGLALFEAEGTAIHRYAGWFDLKDGSGDFHGHARWVFEDGATLQAAYEGTARKEAKDFAVEARFHDFAGTGRMEGATGEGGFTGRRLEPIELGGSTVLHGTLSLELTGR